MSSTDSDALSSSTRFQLQLMEIVDPQYIMCHISQPYKNFLDLLKHIK